MNTWSEEAFLAFSTAKTGAGSAQHCRMNNTTPIHAQFSQSGFVTD
jgi:hypothetical protein